MKKNKFMLEYVILPYDYIEAFSTEHQDLSAHEKTSDKPL